MKKAAVLTILCFMCVLASCKGGSASYIQGLQYLQEGRYDMAVSSLELAQSQGQDGDEFLSDLGLAYVMSSNGTKGNEMLLELLEKNPDNPYILKNMGIYEDYLGNWKTAMEHLEKAIQNEGDSLSEISLDAMGLLANLEYRNGLYADAIDHYNQLIANGFDTAEHSVLAGECYLMIHQLEAARQYFDFVDKQSGKSPKLYSYIYYLEKEYGTKKLAEEYFEKGLKLLKNSDESGIYYADCERYEEAVPLLEGKNDFSSEMAKASCYLHLGKKEQAVETYERLIEKGENIPRVYSAYMAILLDDGEYDAVSQMLTVIQNSDDETAKAAALWNEVILYERKTEYATAYEKICQYIRKYPVTSEIQREYCYLKIGNVKTEGQ